MWRGRWYRGSSAGWCCARGSGDLTYDQARLQRAFLLDTIQRRRHDGGHLHSHPSISLWSSVSFNLAQSSQLRSIDVAGQIAFSACLPFCSMLAAAISLGTPLSLYAL